jgi:hypothetical protein
LKNLLFETDKRFGEDQKTLDIRQLYSLESSLIHKSIRLLLVILNLRAFSSTSSYFIFNKFVSQQDDADVDISNHHTKWTNNIPEMIQDKMINVLKGSDIASAFGFLVAEQALEDSVSKSFFVLLYEPLQTNRPLQNLNFSLHKDVADGENEGRHILSVVLTFRSDDDCIIGGALGVSNRKDGEVYRTEELTEFLPKDSSMYYLNGDFASHCAYAIYTWHPVRSSYFYCNSSVVHGSILSMELSKASSRSLHELLSYFKHT